MHPKYHRRLPHAERARLWKRQTAAAKATGEDSETSTASFILTAPLTLTIVQTIPDSTSRISVSSTSTSSIVEQTSSSSSSSLTGQSTSSTSSGSQFQTSLGTSTASSGSSSSPTSSTVSSSGTLSGTNSSTPIPVSSLSSSNELPGGAIAAIVIAVLITFVGGILYLIRSNSRRTRMKLRPLWTQSKALNKPVGISSATYPFEPLDPPYPTTETRQVPSRTSGLSITIPAASVSVPPSSYNNDSSSSIAVNIVSAASTSPPTLAVYSLGAKATSSPFSTLVASSFITRLPDELSITVGERLRVLAEYDDGWSLCMNKTGEQGMVPNECLNRSGSLAQRPTLAQTPTQNAERRSSRVSSVGWS